MIRITEEEDILYEEQRTSIQDQGICNIRKTVTKRERTSETREPVLEPIVNAGGIRINLLRPTTSYMTVALSLLRGDFLKTIEISTPNTAQFARLPPQELLRNKVAKITQRGRILLFMITFTRTKQRGGARLIGHPPELNAAFKPPHLHLISLSSLIAHITKIAQASTDDTLVFIELDFRNFFPQISIGPLLQPFMGIATMDPNNGKPTFLMQTVLTQGWNASTYIAQSVSWSIIEYHEKDEDNLGLELCLESGPPAFRIAQHELGVAFITIIYDNILLACSSKELAKLWEARIERNTERFNAVRKYTNVTTNQCTYCGIDIKWENHKISWRTAGETFTRWQNKTIQGRSAREAASLLGVILRQCYVRDDSPLLRRKPTLILRNLLASNIQNWDTRNHITVADAETILALRDTMSNDWCALITNHVLPIIIVADATPTRTCFLIFDQNMRIIARESNTVACQNIATTESIAILQAINHLAVQTTRQNLIVVTDNTTVGRSLAKGYSLHTEVDLNIINILETAATKNVQIKTIIDITSDDNIADVGTRHEDWNSTDADLRMKATLERVRRCLPLYKLGSKWIDRQDHGAQ
jgi:hypothetical protein